MVSTLSLVTPEERYKEQYVISQAYNNRSLRIAIRFQVSSQLGEFESAGLRQHEEATAQLQRIERADEQAFPGAARRCTNAR